MSKNGPLQTPFEDPCITTPSASGGTLIGTSGGYSLPDAPTETANMSELGPLVTTVGGLQDAPAPGTIVQVDPAVAAPNVPNTGLGAK